MELPNLYDVYSKHPIICTDTRLINKGCLFFALQGANFDGNKFAAEAIVKGAAYAVVSDSTLQGENFIHVEDTLVALQALANFHRRHFTIPVIAITGSNGKTTTKELITSVLSKKYIVHSTVGNLNNHIGVPLTILGMPNDVEIAIIEMGANHLREINSLCEIAMPTHGIITNIGKAHLEGFGSFEGVRKAKGELFDYLQEHDGYAFVNVDDAGIVQLAKNMITKSTYGFNTNENPNFHFNYSTISGNGGFTMSDTMSDTTIHSTMFGQYNAMNMLAAFVIGKHFDIANETIVKCLSAFEPGSNRSEIIQFADCTIIKDAYNANPSSMELALMAFAERYKQGWVILGDMNELGTETDDAHQHIINIVKSLGFERIYLIGKNFKKAFTNKVNIDLTHFYLADTIDELRAEWNWASSKGRAILLKGSRLMQLEKLLDF